MAIVKNVQLFWVKLDPKKPSRYQNKDTAPATWSLQFRVTDKKEAEALTKEFGFKFTPAEDNGKLVYRTSISKYAFASGPEGKEDPEKPNEPVVVVGKDGRQIDPNKVGNGSIGDVAFYVKDDKSSRTLRGVMVSTWKVFEQKTLLDEFDIDVGGAMEIIQPAEGPDEGDLDSIY